MTRLIALALVIAAFVSGCGLPADDSPRTLGLDEISPQLRPGQLPTPTPEGQIDLGRSDKQIHMIGPGATPRLRLVERDKAETPEDILRILLGGTSPEEAQDGITSAINVRTAGISVFNVNLPFQLVTVDIAPGTLDPDASEQKLIFAQIVFSLTSLSGIERVEFVQSDPDNPEAEPFGLQVLTDTGSTLPGTQVSRDDYRSVDPGTGPVPAFDIPTATPTAAPGVPVTVWKVRQIFQGIDGVEVVGEAGTLAVTETTTESRIIGVVRQLQEVTHETVVANLFAGTPAGERTLGLRSSFPPDAFLNSIEISTFGVQRADPFGVLQPTQVNIATVDLAAGSLPPESEFNERLLAAAQMVFTLTGLEGIDEVTFAVDGESVQMPTDNGLSSLFDPTDPRGLTRLDYALVAPGGYLWLPQAAPVMTPTPIPEPTPTPGG